MKSRFYITSTLPYVNAEPHIGFALEIIRADLLARYHRLIDDEVFFNTGTDEHGQKIYQNAVEAEMDPQDYVDMYAAKFDKLKEALNLSYNNFIRTTDEHHIRAAQEFWRRVDANGFIYKKYYKVKYCVGCELEKQDSDLVDGKCPLHSNRELEIIEEENYFFKFSAFEKKLLGLYDSDPEFVVPANRLKEIRNFVESGLQDFSISRVKSKMPWGVPVPNDEEQVMYVWFDALINYIAAIGWPDNENDFSKWWPGVQIAGKDNLRQQSAMWQAMLMAAELPTSKKILINGFILGGGGVKMSKSLGNIVNPIEYVEKYGSDAVRYFLLAKVSPFEDSDFTKERFEEAYTSDLANGLGNLVARVAAMCKGLNIDADQPTQISEPVVGYLHAYEYDKAIGEVWGMIRTLDGYINENKVWEKEDEGKLVSLNYLVGKIRQIAYDLQIFMPEAAEKIMSEFGSSEVVKGEPLFPRLN